MAAEELSEKDFNREFEAFIAGMKAAKHRPPVPPPPARRAVSDRLPQGQAAASPGSAAGSAVFSIHFTPYIY